MINSLSTILIQYTTLRTLRELMVAEIIAPQWSDNFIVYLHCMKCGTWDKIFGLVKTNFQ